MKIEEGILYDVENKDLNEDGSFVIPDGVTSIASYTFAGCCRLTKITIPNSVTSIGSSAFYNCYSLTDITIPKSVTSIGEWVFSHCNSLTSITIPNSITEIGDYAFDGCRGLINITIPDNVTSIGTFAFRSCTGLTSVTIGNNVTHIGNYAFEWCRSLKSVKIGNSVTTIGESAFIECGKLVSKESVYKGFKITKNGRLRCRDKIYTPDKWSTVNGDLKLCRNGLHYCTNLFEIFNYYNGEIDKDIAIYECEIKGKDLSGETNSKHCCRWLKPVKRLSREEIINILNEAENENKGQRWNVVLGSRWEQHQEIR